MQPPRDACRPPEATHVPGQCASHVLAGGIAVGLGRLAAKAGASVGRGGGGGAANMA